MDTIQKWLFAGTLFLLACTGYWYLKVYCVRKGARKNALQCVVSLRTLIDSLRPDIEKGDYSEFHMERLRHIEQEIARYEKFFRDHTNDDPVEWSNIAKRFHEYFEEVNRMRLE